MEKAYHELEITFNPDNYETIYNRLYMEDITTILEENGRLKIYLPESGLSAAEKIKDDLINLDGLSPNDINLIKFDNKDWNTEWEKTIEPVYIGDKLIVYPSWKKAELIDTENKVLVEIDPKMSFGTGHNETTQLILDLMCRNIDKDDKHLLDFGCGTGILAIAGVKLGIQKAVAIDIDEDSVANAKEYFHVNKVADKIRLYRSDLTAIKEWDFDVITANITSGVIIPVLYTIHSKLKKNGKLFITGILNEESEEMVNSLTEHNFMIVEMCGKAEWCGFYCRKK